VDLKCGVYLPNYKNFARSDALLGAALTAEQYGWDGCFLWDHLLSTPPGEAVVDSWSVLPLMANWTSSISIGCLVTPLARRETTKVALEAITVDHQSQGRLIFGAGLGLEREFEALGLTVDPKERAAKLDDSLIALDKIWRGWPLSEAIGAEPEGARMLPRPYQERLPIWTAISWPSATGPLARAARVQGVFPIPADGFEPADEPLTPADISDVKDALALEFPEQQLPDGYAIAHAGRTSGSAEENRALVAEYANAGVTWWLESFMPDDEPKMVGERLSEGPPAGP
jgi:alkanesulfonate monooxygenase SsuD/methylene tetrahydromethanopterin reductase-like flavin-dependent oxidoreductase (luciferase family)